MASSFSCEIFRLLRQSWLFANPVVVGPAMKGQIEVKMVLVRFVRTRAENRGEIAAGAGPQALQGERQLLLEAGIPDADPASVRQIEADHIDGIAARMFAELAGILAVAGAAFEAGTGIDCSERCASVSGNDRGGRLADPAAELQAEGAQHAGAARELDLAARRRYGNERNGSFHRAAPVRDLAQDLELDPGRSELRLAVLVEVGRAGLRRRCGSALSRCFGRRRRCGGRLFGGGFCLSRRLGR